MHDYLSNHKQYVNTDGFHFLLENIGAPQLNVLGKISFFIYINDIAKCSNFDVTFYAHDNISNLVVECGRFFGHCKITATVK